MDGKVNKALIHSLFHAWHASMRAPSGSNYLNYYFMMDDLS
jgi:hypothetical protein